MRGNTLHFTAAALLACAAVFASCSNERGGYFKSVAPIVDRLQQVSSDADALAVSCRGAAKKEDAAAVEQLQERLSKIAFDFTSIMAPMDYSALHAGMAKGIASEATGLSALKGYCARALQVVSDDPARQAENQALLKGMEGQWKYFEDNRAFFKAHLKIFTNAMRSGGK